MEIFENQVFETQSLRLGFDSRVRYNLGTEEKTWVPLMQPRRTATAPDPVLSCSENALCFQETAWDDSFALVRETVKDPAHPEKIFFRIHLMNNSNQTLFLSRIDLIHTDAAHFSLGGVDSSNWVMYRQGRMKNDLPATSRLGDTGEAFADMVGRLNETGGKDDGSASLCEIVSDELTMFAVSQNRSDLQPGLLIGFLTGIEHDYEVTVRLTQAHQLEDMTVSAEYRIQLPAQAQVSTGWLLLEDASDLYTAVQSYAAQKGSIYQARGSRQAGKGAPSVFCTWYYYGLTVTEADMRMNLQALSEQKIPFDVFQLDEGWEKVLGDWEPNEKFPSGLQKIASDMAEAGFIPGIWTSPFIAHETAPITSQHPEWFLRYRDGSWCLFPMNGTVYRIFDLTRPEVVDYVRQLYVRLRALGYRYHKLDFTRAPVVTSDETVFYDPTMTRAQAYRRAMTAVREGIGEDSYLLICGGLYDAALGLCDGQRSGSDVLSTWSASKKKGIGGKAAPFTIKQALLRSWMNAWWDCDPDALMVRRRAEMERDLNLTYGLLNEVEAQTSVLNQYLCGGLVCSTEPMDQIEDDRLLMLRHILPTVPVTIVPRDAMKGRCYPEVVDAKLESGIHTVGLINWSDEAKKERVTFGAELIGTDADPKKTWRACEFWTGKVYENIHVGDVLDLGTLEAHASILLKIEPEDHLPSVIGTTAHFSFGGELRRFDWIGQTLYFEANNLFHTPVRYRIRLPKGLACPKLPQYCCRLGDDLEIVLPEYGGYTITIPFTKF